MATISRSLREICRTSPERELSVVISLKESSLEVKPLELGIEAESIEGAPGVLKGKLSGTSILELSQRDEVAEISDDFEVTTDDTF